MISLDNLVVFTRIVELGSFTAAGKSLRMSVALVSHRIKRLEEQLNCQLFTRTTRKTQLTDQGRIFYEHCLEVRDAWQRAEASIVAAGGAPRGTLKVTAPLGFGRRVVAPMVARYREAHPEMDVRLRLSDHLVDLMTEGLDVAIRMAVLPDSSLIVRKIGDIERVLCASPAYIEKHGMPQTIEDLENHQCLLLRFPGSQQFRWMLRKGARILSAQVAGHLDADDGDVLTQWALDGAGIAIKPVFEVADHLRSGALVPVLTRHPPAPVTLAVLHAYNKVAPPKVKAFADMIVSEARGHIARSLDGLEIEPARKPSAPRKPARAR